MTTSQLVSQIRKQVKVNGVKYVVIDYLQLLDPDDKRIPREQQVAEQTRRLKSLAKECDIPIILIAQLNRKSAEERPELHHLRESGSIEQDADKVLFLHEVPIEENPNGNLIDVIIAKQRNGPRNVTVRMLFDRPTGRFDNLAREF
jgi:replicative DNA helicase